MTKLLVLLVVVGCLNRGGEVTAPYNWPIPGLTLPKNVRDVEYTPKTGSDLTSKLPRKKRMDSAPRIPPPKQWIAFFRYDGQPVEVFDHIDKMLLPISFSLTDAQSFAVGTDSETLIREYLEKDGKYSVRLTYWKYSDIAGSRPYQLLVSENK